MTGPPVVALVGPTATGKTALGVRLALALDGEIVNADSMALYAGMVVGTATPGEQERRGVPHHLFGVLDPREEADVASYQSAARRVVEQVRARGRAVVVVGGSGLHVRALLDDLRFPGTDPAVRAGLEDELATYGAPALHARLAAVDPQAAAAVLPSNGRRVVRAMEVFALTGSAPRTTLPPLGPARWDAVQVGLDRATLDLDTRIAGRAHRMWDAGLLAETQALVAAGGLGRTASRAIGYASALRLMAGELDEAAAREQTAQATRRLVRRQRSWFRRDPRVRWLPVTDPDPDSAPGPDPERDALPLVLALLGQERHAAPGGLTR